jgi:hypothetical protein
MSGRQRQAGPACQRAAKSILKEWRLARSAWRPCSTGGPAGPPAAPVMVSTVAPRGMAYRRRARRLSQPGARTAADAQ